MGTYGHGDTMNLSHIKQKKYTKMILDRELFPRGEGVQTMKLISKVDALMFTSAPLIHSNGTVLPCLCIYVFLATKR
jgi:hypothetical protein